jgi:hypothetical protein
MTDVFLAIREFFDWLASETEESDLTPEEVRVGLDLIAYRRGLDPEAVKARLRAAIDADDFRKAVANRAIEG